MKFSALFYLLLASFLVCTIPSFSQEKKTKYTVGDIKEYDQFLQPNSLEMEMDSSMKKTREFFSALGNDSIQLDSVTLEYFNKSFLQNRSRIYRTSIENGSKQKIDRHFETGMPVPCDCTVEKEYSTHKGMRRLLWRILRDCECKRQKFQFFLL